MKYIKRKLPGDSTRAIQSSLHSFTSVNIATNTTANTYQAGTEQDISLLESYCFFVKNLGGVNSATLKVQLSPNGIDWVDDSLDTPLAASASTIITASRFLKYIRILYKSTIPDNHTAINVIFQGQS